MSESEHEPAEPRPAERDPAERDPVESARPSIGRRDEPDALRLDTDERPHRTLPPQDAVTEGGTGEGDGPDAPRSTGSPGADR
jgi:hypothetical protein